MKNALGALVMVSALAFAASASAKGAAVAERAPDFELRDLTGKPVKLSALKGRAVLVDFWASWCEPCKKELPILAQMAKKLASQGITIIAVNVDTKRDSAESFLKAHGVQMTVVLDTAQNIIGQYQPPKMPSSFVIDKAGVIRYVNMGFELGDEAKIEKQLTDLAK